jgi:hypothetical protein
VSFTKFFYVPVNLLSPAVSLHTTRFNIQKFKVYSFFVECFVRISEQIEIFTFISIINIQPLGRFWQESEPSQATGMALARCILGTFLGVVCH